MARLWCSGFELNSITSGVEWTSASAGFEIVTSIVKSGSYAGRANADNETIRKQLYNSAQLNQQYFKSYVYFAALPSSGNVRFMSLASSGGTEAVGIGIKSTGKMGIFSAGTQQGSDSTTTFTTGVWYLVEANIGYGISATRTLKVSGVTEVTSSFTNTTSWDRVYLGILGTANSADIYFDDFVADSSEYPGDGRLYCLRPKSGGDSNQFEKSDGSTAGDSNNYQNCDESPTPNDATDFVREANSDAQIDLYTSQTLGDAGYQESSANVTIKTVYVGLRHRVSNTAAAGTWGKCKEGGSTSTSSEYYRIDSANTWTTWGVSGGVNPIYKLIMTTKPSGGAWTGATVDAIQIGFESEIPTARNLDVTAVWAYVELVPEGGNTTYFIVKPSPTKFYESVKPVSY